jgi:hypothetical protein
MDKRWPLTLIKRGVRVGTTSRYPETIWWQETNPEAKTADAARNIGYEAYDFVPFAYAERIAGSSENLIRFLKENYTTEGYEVSGPLEDLQMVVDSFRDNVKYGQIKDG